MNSESIETIVYGMIDAGVIDDEETVNPHHQLNRDIITALPLADGDPPLTRDLFSLSSGNAQFRSQIIRIGGSFDSLERYWKEWLEKFEDLLRGLYWFSAVIHLESEVFEGDYTYQWLVTEEALDRCLLSNPMKPVDEWEFSGGPREFEIY